MAKAYTDLDQSKKLAEFLPAESADMKSESAKTTIDIHEDKTEDKTEEL